MIDDAYTDEQIARIAEYVDVTAPPSGQASLFVFGTNQIAPANIAADRYRDGLAPLIIVTGGVNRHNGIVEGRELRRLLTAMGVADTAIRTETESANTWQNVEFSLPFLREAGTLGLPLAVVCKWYHRRAIHCLRTLLPGIGPFYAVTYEPIYSGVPITRENWFTHPDGRSRILREWQEVSCRTSDGSYAKLERVGGAWQ